MMMISDHLESISPPSMAAKPRRELNSSSNEIVKRTAERHYRHLHLIQRFHETLVIIIFSGNYILTIDPTSCNLSSVVCQYRYSAFPANNAIAAVIIAVNSSLID